MVLSKGRVKPRARGANLELAPGRFPELRPFLRKGLAHYGRLRYRSSLHAGSGPSSRVLKYEFADRQEREVIIIDYEHTRLLVDSSGSK